MHGFKSAILAIFQFLQNGAYESTYEIFLSSFDGLLNQRIFFYHSHTQNHESVEEHSRYGS